MLCYILGYLTASDEPIFFQERTTGVAGAVQAGRTHRPPAIVRDERTLPRGHDDQPPRTSRTSRTSRIARIARIARIPRIPRIKRLASIGRQ